MAYHSLQRAVPGRAEHTAMWSGRSWHFAIAAHRERFLAAPERCAPRCGGYCAFAVSFCDRPSAPAASSGRPTPFTIADGRLYLNANCFAHALFRLLGRARKAEEVWGRLAA